MGNMLEVRELEAHIGRFHILQGVTFDVPAGRTTVLLGRNGAGKTTTLRAVMGLVRVGAGTVRLAGDDLVGRRPFHIAQLGIGYVPEDRGVFGTLSVEENLRVAERRQGSLRARRELVFDLFPDLARFQHRKAGQLSGGQQQMLAIARGLVNENKLLLVDEPSKGLAPIVIQRMIEALREISKEMTILLVEQNFAMAAALADTCVVIDEGRTVHAGPMADLAEDASLQRRWLGVGGQEAV